MIYVNYSTSLFSPGGRRSSFENIPCDNNPEEQDIHIVVKKRKKYFGSKTEAGAHAFEILLSVAWSTWYERRGASFPGPGAPDDYHVKQP